jgi:biotin carboxylase
MTTVVLVYQRISLPWVFQAARRAGIDVVLVPRPDETVTLDAAPDGVVDVLPLDVFGDPAHALDVLRRQHCERGFDGIVTLYDPAVPFVAEVADALGLPGIGAANALAAQDKRLMRTRLAAAGCKVPGFVTLESAAAWAQAADLAFPVVIKPATGYSSLGVTRVDARDDLASTMAEVAAVSRATLGADTGFVVEEYLDGPEYAVESLAYQGELQVLTIGYKGEPTGPYFEEGVYRAPAHLSDAVTAAIVGEVTAAHKALGIADGPTHTELRLRGGHTPYILEVGARVGGSGVSHYIVEGATGVDFAAQALRVAAGLAPSRFTPGGPAPAIAAAANYIVPCGGSGPITAIHGFDEVRADSRVDHLVQMLFPGDVVRPYPEFSGYPAFVLSRHPDTADAEDFHAALERDIRVEYRP